MQQKKEKNINNKKYDLFACINHIGSLHKGHYYCNVKQDKWIKYDDSHVVEDDDINVSNVYILVYKANNDEYYENKNYCFNFNFVSVMDTAYKIYIGQLNFDHIFNYIINDKGDIVEEFKNNCFYYYVYVGKIIKDFWLICIKMKKVKFVLKFRLIIKFLKLK